MEVAILPEGEPRREPRLRHHAGAPRDRARHRARRVRGVARRPAEALPQPPPPLTEGPSPSVSVTIRGVGVLHIVATPIGNLEDVTLRALRVLGRSRPGAGRGHAAHAQVLLRAPRGEGASALAARAQRDAARIERVLGVLDAGGSDVALVSDAGTPILSDPGARLVDGRALAGRTSR